MNRPVVLVAEDSLVIRAVVREQLEAQGYGVLEASDGEEGLLLCRAERPDVVLLDVEMPKMNGYEVLAAIKKEPDLAHIPIVFLTARAETRDVVDALRLGAHDYLRKPFEPAELIARVSAALRVKSLEDELRRRNVELDQLSRTDPLTDLYNRRHIQEHFAGLASAAARHGYVLGALMIDIDHFKRINDSAGHAAGDSVLRAVASRIRAAVRTEDLVGRWGGEEFVVLLQNTEEGAIGTLGERIRSSVAADPVEIDPDRHVVVTVSVGCATGPTDPEDILRRADEALYAAKEAGRDRVVTA